jgi:hypothetical protein
MPLFALEWSTWVYVIPCAKFITDAIYYASTLIIKLLCSKITSKCLSLFLVIKLLDIKC